jgi:4-diphosphocytidyl-2-C-methyl-D-erythritol kinase
VTVHETAPAKINIGLKILGRRPDGFHDILSIFQTVGLCDELDISDEGEPGLACDAPDITTGPENLVLRADRDFRETFGAAHPVRFTLRKRIPAGAGLGGGSTDAAAALRGLNRLSGGGTRDRALLTECAARLGSDVPFLLDGGTAVVSGRGERISPLEWPFDFTYVIVYPGFGVSTAWAYSRVKEYASPDDPYFAMLTRLSRREVSEEDFLDALSNDFEPVVVPEHPGLANIRSLLFDYGASAAFLSGSGSSFVGVFSGNEQAGRCADSFRGRGLKAWAVKAFPQGSMAVSR